MQLSQIATLPKLALRLAPAMMIYAAWLPARPIPADVEAPENLELLAPMQVERLDNGMTFLLYPNDRAPIFSGVIKFDVGGKDEVPGKSGIAHMFEHMAFKGTTTFGSTDIEAELKALRVVEQSAYAHDNARNLALSKGLEGKELEAAIKPEKDAFLAAREAAAQYVVKDEFDAIYNREGANGMNATTSQDATTYFISLPSNRLPLWAAMESDRLLHPVLREFYSERDVVMEERRMRNDNSPFGKLWEATNASAYTAHPYGYPVIGWEEDIRNLKATNAQDFFSTHYTPGRGVGVLVGDFDVEETRELLREKFGRLPASPAGQLRNRIVPEPEQEGERRVSVELDATPILLMAWHKPCAPDPADVRSEVLEQVLTGGRSARWFEMFVKEQRIASDVGCFTGPGDYEPNMLMVYATPQGDTPLDAVEKAIREDLTALKDELIDGETLTRAKKMLRADTLREFETNMGLALSLAKMAQIGGDPWYLERRMNQLDAVTAEDLRGFVRAYLVDRNLTVGEIQRPEAPEAVK